MAPQEPSVVASGSEAVEQADETVSLDPAEPEGVVVLVRWNKPNAVFDALRPSGDKQHVGALVATGLIEGIFDIPGFYEVVDLGVPAGAVVALQGGAGRNRANMRFGFTIGLRSTQDARSLLERNSEIRELPRGAYRVDVDMAGNTFACEVSEPSLSRMVCCPKDRDLRVLGPYLMRSLPVTLISDNGFSGQLRLGRIADRFGGDIQAFYQSVLSELADDEDVEDRALQQAGLDAFRDGGEETIRFLNDLDVLRFEGNWDRAAKELTLELGLAFRSRTSWITQRFFDNASQAGPPPAIFWSAPVDSASVFFYRGSEAKNYDSLRRHTNNLLSSALVTSNLPVVDQKSAVDLVDRLFDSQAASVVATGLVLPKTGPGAPDLDRMYDKIVSSIGWRMVGFDEPSKRLDTWLSDLSRLYGRPAVQKGLREVADVEAASMPRVSYGPMNVPGLYGLKALQVTVPASVVAAMFRESASDIPKGAKPLTGYVLLLPDDNRTWIAAGGDRSILEKQLKAVKAGGSNTIATMDGLNELRSAHIDFVGGGFTSFSSFVGSAVSSALFTDILGVRDSSLSMISERSTLVHQSMTKRITPMLVRTRANEESSEVAIDIRVTRAALADFQ